METLKSSTSKIVLFEPDEHQLKTALAGRPVSPGLAEFLKNLLKRKKWTRKINIPSDHDDVAAVLVFTTTLKDGGLEMFSELHIFFAGRTKAEKWRVVGESERFALLPKEALRAIDISKVWVKGEEVDVEFSVPLVGGQSRTLVKTFDFSVEDTEIRVVPHPFLQIGSLDAAKQSA